LSERDASKIGEGYDNMILKERALRLAAHLIPQPMLERVAEAAEGMMGVGMGSRPETSGEAAFLRKLREGKPREEQLCVFDVGANEGQFLTLVERELAGYLSAVHAFEPGRAAFDALSANARQFSNVVLNNVALSGRVGESILYYDKPGSGLASFARRRLDHFGIEFEGSEIVQVETLDDYCARNSILCIDLLKLDVEGNELEVLRGGVGMFEQKRVQVVAFEFGGCDIDTRTFFQDFWYFFAAMGMKHIYRIVPAGRLFPIQRYQETCERFRTTNFVASLKPLHRDRA